MVKFYLKALLIGLVGIVVFNQKVNGQLLINEICPTNISINQNSNGDYDDWIELHNNSASSLNIGGYGLTDDPSKPFDFQFPSYTLNAGQKVIVFSSGKSNEVIAHHWEMPVDANSSWKYKAGSAALDTNWRNRYFVPTGWSTGNAGIGFGDGDDNTTIPVGVSVMMRKTFVVSDTSKILKAVLMMDYDDAFVAYLNGVEIARANIGTDGFRPVWNELANSSHEANRYQGLPLDSFFIKRSLLKSILLQDTNVLAIEVHNAPANSDDMSSIPYLFFGMRTSGSTYSSIPSWFHVPSTEYFNADFKLSRNGETVYLFNPAGVQADSKTYFQMEADNSIGRKPDGSAGWCLFSTPTPNASNNSSICYTAYANPPVFSKVGGYYSGTQTLTLINSTPGGIIRYTTNGNTPTASSPSYSSPITISSTKTIRAKVFASGYLPSPMVTNTIIINGSTHLSTFSITTDSLNLWDYNTGIYVLGPGAAASSPYKGANFWMDWEKPATIEYFDKNKNLIVRFDGDIKIYGNYSRAKAQKSFEIKLSDKYGMGNFIYQMFPDKSYVDDINNIVLRNSGTDWNKVHFRDAYMERVMKNTYTGYLAAEPTIAYLNGAYWGVYCISENHDHHWMKDNFGLGKDEIDYLKESGSSIKIQEGTDDAFWTLYNYATVQTPTTQAYYDFVNKNLDLQNYTDYFIAETFYNNGDWIGDWTNNIQMWRPNKPGSKWRYLLYDLDFGLALSGSVNDNRLAIARNPPAFSHSSEMFDAVLKNPTYKRYFINRYADLINTIYLPANMDAFKNSFKDTMSFDMPAHFAKWGSSVSSWNTYISGMMSFANARPGKVQDFIKTEFSLAGKVTLTLQASPAGAGRIEISTITPNLPWSGVYFNGNPVTITAIPNPGYTFDHWHSSTTITTNNFNKSVTYNFASNDQITAFFTGSAVTPQLCISELNYNSLSTFDAGDWIELHNFGSVALDLSGWKLSDGSDNHNYIIPTGTTIAPNGYLVFAEDTGKFAFKFPSVNKLGPIGFNFSNGGDQIRLFKYQGTIYESFYYQDLIPWPVLADGSGYTCELSANTANPNDGNSWFAGCIGGSPGQAYSPMLSIPVSISGTTTFCSGGSATLNATNVPGYSYQWRRNGIIIPGAVDTVYYATQSGNYTVNVTYQGCSTTSSPTTISVVTQQPPPISVSASRCGPGALSLAASASDSVFWYDAPSGGNQVGAGDTLFIPYLSQTTTYYAITGHNCASTPVAANATITPEAATPVAVDVSRCGPGSVTLTATDTAAIRWFTAAIGGGLLETGGTFVTNILNSDTSFFVEAGSVCPSSRVQVNVTVTTSPEPVVTDASRCGSGSITLNAASNLNVAWYHSAIGGNPIFNGNAYTSSLAVTDTFYAEANGGCPSVRVMGIALINPVPSNPVTSDVSICNPGSVTLTAAAPEIIRWYDAPTGGNLLFTGAVFSTPVLNVTTPYYVENGYICPSQRIPVQAIISAAPASPLTSNVQRCGPGSITLNASSSQNIYWYSAPTGGTLLSSNSSYTIPSLSVTTTYYVEAGDFCRSARIPVQAIIDPIPSPPTALNVSNCGAGSVTLNASSSQSIYWYDAASGGTLLGTNPSYVTPVLSTTTTYYVETGDICRSSRIAVQAIISTPPTTPTAPDVSRCGNGTVTLNAASNASISWFSGPSGGTAIANGNSYTTPPLSATTTYYVESNNGCVSTRVPVDAIINPIPNPPTASNVTNCGSGQVTLTASAPQQIYWYTAASGGSPAGTGSTYLTPNISVTTTYYVETGGTCRSTRIPVQAIIVQSLAAPTLTGGSNCGQGTVTLTASSSTTVNWFTSPSGGTSVGTGLSFTTPPISVTTTYYAEATSSGCFSPRASVQAVINNPPAAPVTSNGSRCGSGTVTVSVTSGTNINWYSVPSGGVSLGTGNSYTTQNISVTTTYYAESNNNGCAGPRSSVQAIINPIPAAPITANVNHCGAGSVTLSASSLEQIYWYTVASGGSPVSTGSTYNTPTISTTTTYFVETGDICRSNRIPVQAVITQIPAAPSLTSAAACGSGSVTLIASSSSSVSWFTSASGGSPIFTGLSFITPVISTTTTYYAEATSSGCTSTRSSVQAVINPIPAAPVTTGGSRCGTGSVSLSATSTANVNWYTVANGGISIGSGLSFNTPSISTTTTYYAETFDGCKSTRSAAQAVINPIPAAPTISGASHCGPGSVTLSAVSPEQVNWFTAATGGTSISTGTSFVTPTLNLTTTYYVEAGTTCISNRIPVQAVINFIPLSPTLTDGSHCGPGTVVLTASSSAAVSWFTAASGGNPIGTGLSFTTPTIPTTTTFYAEAGPAGCSSPRVPVQAVINPVPASPTGVGASRCGPGSVTLTAAGSGQLYWYSTSSSNTILDSGAAFITPSLNSTRNYYVATTNGLCKSSRVAVQALINQLPSPPVASNVSRCSSGTITLNASAPQTIYWYDAATGGTLLTTGTTYTTPVLAATTTYYIETGTTCLSIRVPVQAQIVSPPNPPTLIDTAICGSGAATIRAISNLQVNWFDVPSGGTALDTGLFFITPIITGPTTFYAEAGFGCNSLRVPVNVSILSPPSPPTAADSTRCGAGSLLLAAFAPDSLYWYDSSIGGSLLGAGAVFTTPVIYSNSTYYVETGRLCRSTRIPVQAILTGTQITAASQNSICGSGSAVLSVVATVPSDSVFWYDQLGGINIGTGNYFITPNLNTTTTYYVVTHSTCTGPPVPVAVNVYPVPVVNLGSDTIIVQSGLSVILDAGPGFNNYLWSTNDTTQTLEVFTVGNYFVNVTDINGCAGTDQVFVDFINGINTVSDNNNLSIYPNPASDKLTVVLHGINEKSLVLNLFAIDGKLLKTEEVKSSNTQFSTTLSLSGISAGVYVLVAENSSYRATIRVVVE